MIVNLLPDAETSQAELLRPISLTIRDPETYIDLEQIMIRVGYARVFSRGEALFDLLPSTDRVSLRSGAVTDGLCALVEGGVLIAKDLDDPQRTVYATRLEAGAGYKSVMFSAKLRRD